MPRLVADGTLQYELTGSRYVAVHSPSAEDDGMLSGGDASSRVSRLETIVRDQQVQIEHLKSAVEDIQRKLCRLSKGASTPVQARSPRSRVNGVANGLDKVDGKRNRPALHVNSTECLTVTHYQSTNSLHSDGLSGSPSGSPISTPSPTYSQQRQLSTTASNLNKRWHSTSDFQRPLYPNGTTISSAAKARAYPGSGGNARRGGTGGTLSSALSNGGSQRHLNGSHRDLYRQRRETQPNATPRRAVTGSLQDISRRRLQHQRNTISDMTYNAEEGTLRIYIKGRPVTLHADSESREVYDLTNTVPASEQQLTVDWVYGYRGKDCRNNLYLLPTGELVYFIAGVAVLYSLKNREQRHYTSHTDDIKCLAVHPNRCTIATGQCAGTRPDAQPQVHVWDSVSLKTLRVLGGAGPGFDRGVSCLSFSRTDGGALLACVDEGHQDRVLSVWDWQAGDMVTEIKASAETVVDVQWHPLDESVLITCGRQHVCFWLLEAASLQRKQGVFGGRDRPKYVGCMTFTDSGDLVTGDSDGRLLVWQRGGNQVARSVRDAHDGAIFSLHVTRNGNLISAGKDGSIIEWDRDFNKTGRTIQTPEELGAPRIVSPGRDGQLIVGTVRNCVALCDWSAGFGSPLVIGHTDEVWATAVHPGGESFVTSGWDSQLIGWNSVDHTVIWRITVEAGVQSCAFSSDGSRLVAGCVSGVWLILDTDTRQTIYKHQDGDEPIQAVQFSPDGTTIALGSRNNAIYIYQATDDGYDRVAKCTGHSSFITHLDWSEDGSTIRSNSGDYELLYWSAETGRQLTNSSDQRDTVWATDTCTLTFKTAGIYPEGADGTDVNTCASSFGKQLLASGDDFGKVKLFPFPASHPRTEHHTYGGHSSHVTCVQFAPGDRQLFSAGGRDMSVIQWNVE